MSTRSGAYRYAETCWANHLYTNIHLIAQHCTHRIVQLMHVHTHKHTNAFCTVLYEGDWLNPSCTVQRGLLPVACPRVHGEYSSVVHKVYVRVDRLVLGWDVIVSAVYSSPLFIIL